MNHTGGIGVWERLRAAAFGSELRTHLARGSLGSFAVKVGQIVLAFAVSIVLARSLGAAGYGVYAYVLTLVTFLSIPAQFGLPVLVVRETAKAQSAGDWSKLKGIWRWATGIAGLLSLLVAVIGGLLAWTFQDHFSSLQISTFAWALLLVPLVALGNLRGAALQGLRRVVQGQLPETILRPGLYLLILASVLLWWPAVSLTPSSAMALHVVAALLAFGVGAVLLIYARPTELKHATASYEHRMWMRSALPLGAIAAMGLINQQTDILMLGFFVQAEEIGQYRVAAQGATLVSFGLAAIGMVTMPYFARFYQNGNMKQFQRLATASARAILLIAIPVALIFILLGEWLLENIFGADFVAAYAVLVVLSLAHLIHSGFGTIGPLLNMTGHERITLRGIGVAALLNVLLNLMMIPVWGAIGAAIATGVSLGVWNLLLWRAVMNQLGIDSSAVGAFARA